MKTISKETLNAFLTERMNEYHRAGLTAEDHPDPHQLILHMVDDLLERFTIPESKDESMCQDLAYTDVSNLFWSIPSQVTDYIETDDEDRTIDIIQKYNASPAPVREVINSVYIDLCGYSLITISKQLAKLEGQNASN